ncbi:cellulose biosynthesis protein BcsC [Pseudomonas vanderleydeniana]|uniref:BCSC C-terminal domain-containing protein n=1 Tax=Pseudomonas vanderleydeniana TaxID=2745495 RepID=A0A9E6TSL5_9PSED|nr:cellulose biosynthesis protein BcsC [Pseudomonas vanderleydeniana]QXI28290.1 BCSC C-terminal domain-containing protein [Pseudomonas vanderleydeniana]
MSRLARRTSLRRTLPLALLVALASTAARADDPQAQLIEQGRYWQAQHNPDRAMDAWNKLLLLAPDQPEALYGLGLGNMQLKRPDEARKYLARLQALVPPPRQARQLEQDIALGSDEQAQLLARARKLVDGNQYDEAVKVYRQLFNGRQPQGDLAREFYFLLGYTRGGEQEARTGLERLLREHPDDRAAALFLAKHMVRNLDTRAEGIRRLAVLARDKEVGSDANETWRFALTWIGPPAPAQVPLFEQFLAAHPDDREIRELMNKGKALTRSNASTAKAAAWRRDPLDARGLQALEAGDLAAAEQAFQARLQDKPDDPDALGGLGIVRQKQERLDEAEDLLVRATRQPAGHPWRQALDNVRYWRLMAGATAARKAGRQDQARKMIEQAASQSPGQPASQVALANLQAQEGQLAKAEAAYRRILANHRDDPQALNGLVGVLAQQGKADEALKLIDSLSPAAQARLNAEVPIRSLRATQVARVAEQRGDLKAAEQAYRQALTDDPGNAWTRFALARIYLGRGRTQAARDQINDLLKRHPDQPDALYTRTLLAAQLGEWQDAQASLARIPPARRSRAMDEFGKEIALHVQTEAAVANLRRGQRQEAQALLARSQALAEGKPERVAILASAYIDAGQPQQGVALMRDLVERSPNPDSKLQLLYADILFKAEQDNDAADILRNLQGTRLSDSDRRHYAALVKLYRIKQADQLREKGNLVAAYDMLKPILRQSPRDPQANAALARLYSANGNNAKAMALYKPLLENDPRNADLQLSVASLAAQAHDNARAEKALKTALALKPGVPKVLTSAATTYRAMGRSSEAAELLRQAVAIEGSQRRANPPFGTTDSDGDNPFLDLPGQPRRVVARAEDPLRTASESADTMPADPSLTTPLYGSADSLLEDDPAPAGNPFAGRRPGEAAPEELSPTQRALNDILQERSGYVAQGLSVRSNNNEPGLSKLTDVEAPFEANLPAGDNRVALRVTPVSLHAGSAHDYSLGRFGSGLPSGSPGSQQANGVGLAVAVESPPHGIKADIGVSPVGFTYNTVIGGISLEQPMVSSPNMHYSIALSRRPVTDSLTSFAGTQDRRTGVTWGGVTANGGRALLGYDDQEVGLYGYGALHKLVGNNVEDNTRAELGGGIYWYLDNQPDEKLTVGLSTLVLSYENNQGFFTYGHGGYFSPQTFFSVAVPVNWSQRSDRFSYRLNGALGVQYINQKGADYFPGHSAEQAANNLTYPGKSSTGVGYNLNAAGEYRLGSHLLLGGEMGVDNAQDYREINASLYLRYLFEKISGPMALPVSPYRSPYSN